MAVNIIKENEATRLLRFLLFINNGSFNVIIVFLRFRHFFMKGIGKNAREWTNRATAVLSTAKRGLFIAKKYKVTN